MSTVIKSITNEAIQGYSEPFLCTTEDNIEYYVKGLRSRRDSQINEWICGNIAQALNLLIAPFRLLTVPDYLYEELPARAKGIGLGDCFGSQAEIDTALFEINDIHQVSLSLQTRIAAFDWLVKNGDRTKGNPNLLYRPHDKINSVIIIDHNLAFDKSFNSSIFLETHIFADAFKQIFTDCVLQAEISSYLMQALPAYRAACDNLPSKWEWMNEECDLPTNYDFQFAEATLARLTNGQLWRLT